MARPKYPSDYQKRSHHAVMKIQFFRNRVEDLEDEHDKLVRREKSPKLETIEQTYIAKPETYAPWKIRQIDLTVEEREHVIEHIEHIIYGTVRASKRTEFYLYGDTVRKRYISSHRNLHFNLDPATRQMLAELLRAREYSI